MKKTYKTYKPHSQKTKHAISNALKKSWQDGNRDHLRGQPNEATAKTWRIKSPDGKTYQFKNLRQWCKENEKLFLDDMPNAKLPLWQRVALGITKSSNRKSKNGFKGWLVVSKNSEAKIEN